MKFEWDNKKAAANIKYHGISFQEAASVFGDSLAITFNDPDSSFGEYRFLTFGTSRNGKSIIVSHTESNGSIRIISARLMEKREKKIYQEG
uniref:Uncharacterized protein n=1 Tax=Candidatus Kentrum sp. FW TaxID=2126338 RepID=A0A450RVN7_9GAMM|nr:MAG: hypothetical protein BECKFW1821A_GA0114235_100314 [Candidatus Kentron sp. FW]